MPIDDDAHEATPLPGLPCWLAGASTQSPEDREVARLECLLSKTDNAGPETPHQTPPSRNSSRFVGCVVVTAIVLLLSAAIVQGVTGLLQGSPVPLWLCLAHLPYVWLGVKLKHWLQQVATTPLPKIKIGESEIRGHLRGQIRQAGVYRDEENALPWEQFAAFEFVGEADGYFVTRLIRSASTITPAPARPLRVRLKYVATNIKAEFAPHIVAFLLPGIATLVLAMVSLRVYGWQPAVCSVFCLLALHLMVGAFVVVNLIKGIRGAPRHTQEAGRKDMYLLFGSRDVAAQDVLRRLRQYIGDTTS